jgi:hypothetical protein
MTMFHKAGLSVLWLAFLPALWCQGSAVFSGQVQDSRAHRYLFMVDQGNPGTGATVSVQLDTPAVSGLYAELWDIEQASQWEPMGLAAGFVDGAGQIQLNVMLPPRNGSYPVMLYLETRFLGPASNYSGQIDTSAGVVVQQGFTNQARAYAGFLNHFGHVGDFYRLSSGERTFTVDMNVDFGPTSHQTTFGFGARGTNVQEVRVLDAGQDPPALLLHLTATGGQILDSALVTTPSYSGETKLRVEFKTGPGDGEVSWIAVFRVEVSLVSGLELTPPGRSQPNQDNTCSTGTGTLPWGGFAAVVTAVLIRPRRRGVQETEMC